MLGCCHSIARPTIQRTTDIMDRMIRIFVHFCASFRYKSRVILLLTYPCEDSFFSDNHRQDEFDRVGLKDTKIEEYE